MHRKDSKGFTLIELLVVIAIIGLLSTLAVVALNSARQKSRDSKRVADIKQVQTALELFYADHNGYPVEATATELGVGTKLSLCGDGTTGSTDGWKSACVGNDTTYMGLVPKKPLPADNATCGASSGDPNRYMYVSADGSTYTINFCLGGAVGDLSANVRTASPNGIQ